MSSDVLLSMKTVVGEGPDAIIIEPRANAVRIKPRNAPEMFVRYDVLPEFTRAVAALARNLQRPSA